MFEFLLFIGIPIYTTIGILTNDYLNDDRFDWSSVPVILFWPVILFILNMMIMIKDIKERRRR